jgi:diaminohydroxyphosphoribosylaminopyrimidine deaminase/5-amino-6-(5-phosphoribosylamino)uracil reductase
MSALTPAQLHKAMRTACAEARLWLGATPPNPPVGAVVLDKNGTILAAAAHHHAGEAHAEVSLIAECRAKNILHKIHTLCVTLEPCNHHGRTPPCVDAILEAGIRRVVIGTRDPNPHVPGGGIDRLRQAGAEVIVDVNEHECRQLIHAFAYHAQTSKPWVTIKRAFDENGSMIPAAGQKTFTSPESLSIAHRLRKKTDAIVTGSGTILADSPLFTVRHVADHADKKRWLGILDRRGRVSHDYLTAAEQRGLMPVIYTDITAAIADLTRKGAQDILVEAGPSVSDAMLNAGLCVMKVDILKGQPDTMNIDFNADVALPFKATEFRLEWVLPE